MYKQANAALLVPDLKLAEKSVLMCLAIRANESGICFPSHERIAEDCSMGIATAKRATKSLQQKGIIAICGKKGRANVYKILAEQYQSDTIEATEEYQSDTIENGEEYQKVDERYQSDTVMVSERYSNIPLINQKNKEADVVEFKEASPQTTYNDYELDPDKRRANHQHNYEMAVACGLIKAK